ncbi:MAG: hypothetical protein L0H25_10860 [Micrococcales bacterium]|nr:hypothetical protein [Micrococcales bacterium]
MPPIARLVLILALIVVVMVVYGRVVGRRDRERSLNDLTPRARAAVAEEIAAGHKVNAIKLYRDATGAPLADARRAVDGWYVTGQGTRTAGRAASQGSLTQEACLRISALVRDGRREEARALYADATGASDAEATAIIRTWDPDQNI